MQNKSLDINLEQRSYKYLNLSNNNNNINISGNINHTSLRHNNSLSEVRLSSQAHNSRNFNEERSTDEDGDGDEDEEDSLTRHRTEWAISNGEKESRTATEASDMDTNSETEEYYSTDDTERMQLNPSTDFYDEDEDDEVYMDESSETYEMIPEAKKLIQVSPTDVKNVDKTAVAEEEEDMGYDEDDERIAAERSSSTQQSEKGYMNEEGSGIGDQAAFKMYKSNLNDNRFSSLTYLRKQQQQQQQHKKGQQTESGKGGQQLVDTRESSGNFANDDDEDDNDDDDDSDEGGDSINGDGAGFFNTKRKPNNRYFRKNTNDAIKIISTPLGKVGIVYQQTPTQHEDAAKRHENTDKKPTTALTDFDALSPDPDSSRLASSHPKITPVLTPDGKVALLYRGDSENTKYEPIRNLTHKFNTNNNKSRNNTFYDNKESAISNNNNNKKKIENKENNDNYDNNDDDDDDDITITYDNSNGNPTAGRSDDTNTDETNLNLNNKQHASYSPVNIAPTTGSFIVRPTDSILPMINKPLSEVLGIKKNQFKTFRVKDATIVASTSTDSIPPRTLPGTTQDEQTTNLHFLTKVNLAEYPTSIRSRNRDFDFSQDNTMLDERGRQKSNQEQLQSNDMQNGKHNEGALNVDGIDTFTNEEMLSKTEVVDLAIIPHFDNELDRFNRYDGGDGRRHHRNRQTIHRRRPNEEDLSGIHCIMQAMMGIAAISTVFGMLGTFFKQRILDQLRLMHW